MIQLTEEASEFAQLIQKHYDDAPKTKVTKTNELNIQKDTTDVGKTISKDPLDKYNIDYSKWKDLNINEDETKKR